MEKKERKRAPGGGRKPKGRVAIHFRIDPDVIEILDEVPPLKKSDYVNDAVRLKHEQTKKEGD